MSTDVSTEVRVVKPSDVAWSEAYRGPEEREPPGVQFTAFEAGAFSTGFWQRDEQARPSSAPTRDRLHHPGRGRGNDEDGRVVHAGPGDIMITPREQGVLEEPIPVRKFWPSSKSRRSGTRALARGYRVTPRRGHADATGVPGPCRRLLTARSPVRVGRRRDGRSG